MKVTKEEIDIAKDSLKTLCERAIASLIARTIFEIVKHMFM